jgi:hypothetical protein
VGNHGHPGGALDREPPGMGAASEGLRGAGWGGEPLEGRGTGRGEELLEGHCGPGGALPRQGGGEEPLTRSRATTPAHRRRIWPHQT